MVNNLLIITLFYLCTGYQNNSHSTEFKNTEQVLTNDWIKDKNGCLKLRNKELAYKLIEENNLKNKSKEEFLKVFGVANKNDTIKNNEILIYYFDCVCFSNQLKENGDKCYANFYFEKEQLKSEEFICE